MRFLVIISFVILFSNCYLTTQSYYQVKLLGEMKPFKEALADPQLSDQLKKKIILVMKVREFAIQYLKMKRGDSYTHLIYVDQPYVAYNVSAAFKDKLQPLHWNFPVIGKVPYLGFFKKEDAIKAELDLKSRGYDTRLRGVPAYSTLGYFPDPFYSSMAKYPEPIIINTVIHEMTHETVFIKDNVEFNEALANFVASKGTVMFIKEVYGDNSKLLSFVMDFEQDNIIFSQFIEDTVKKLNIYYNAKENDPKVLKDRENYFKKIQKDFKVRIIPQLKTKFYKGFSKLKLNNAYILSFKRYYYDMTLLEQVYKKLSSNIPDLLSLMKEIQRSNTEPYLFLRTWLKSNELKP